MRTPPQGSFFAGHNKGKGQEESKDLTSTVVERIRKKHGEDGVAIAKILKSVPFFTVKDEEAEKFVTLISSNNVEARDTVCHRCEDAGKHLKQLNICPCVNIRGKGKQDVATISLPRKGTKAAERACAVCIATGVTCEVVRGDEVKSRRAAIDLMSAWTRLITGRESLKSLNKNGGKVTDADRDVIERRFVEACDIFIARLQESRNDKNIREKGAARVLKKRKNPDDNGNNEAESPKKKRKSPAGSSEESSKKKRKSPASNSEEGPKKTPKPSPASSMATTTATDEDSSSDVVESDDDSVLSDNGPIVASQEDMEDVQDTVEILKDKHAASEARIRIMEAKSGALEKTVWAMERRAKSVETKIMAVDTNMGIVAAKIGIVEAEFGILKSKIENLENASKKLKKATGVLNIASQESKKAVGTLESESRQSKLVLGALEIESKESKAEIEALKLMVQGLVDEIGGSKP